MCLDGACRPLACADLECGEGLVCQGGPFCIAEDYAEEPVCDDVLCIEGYVCQRGPMCRDAREDLDGDGVPSQLDCDDTHPLRYPSNPEVCDGLDNDCNGATDDEAPCANGGRCCGETGCIDPTSNRENCGACGAECDIYEECVDSRCIDAEPPLITAVTPDPLPTGVWLGRDENEPLYISGEHLLGFATVSIESSSGTSTLNPFEVVTTAQGSAYTNDQSILLDGARLPAGPAVLRLLRNDGEESNDFEVNILGAYPPEITSLSPDPLPLGEETTVSVYGTGFWGEPELLISPDQREWYDLPVQWVTETWIRTGTVTLDPALNPPGTWLAVVRNQDGLESTLFPFEVAAAPAPELTGTSPASAHLDEEVTLEIFGIGMFGTPTVSMALESDPEVVVFSPLVDLVDSRRVVTGSFVLSRGLFSAESYLLWVTNPDDASSNRLRFVVLE